MSTSAPRTNPRAVRSQSAERSAPMRPTNALSAAKTPSQTQTNVAKTTLTRPSSASRVRPPQTKEPTTSDPSRQPKLSAIRFDSHKAANPFSTQKKHKTNFGVVYSQGGIPCRINHGGVHHKLQWDRPIQSIDYNPIFVTFAEGLLESEHPYCFVARAGFKEMCQVEVISLSRSSICYSFQFLLSVCKCNDRERRCSYCSFNSLHFPRVIPLHEAQPGCGT
eukprot:TRINITY_DN937_c0_g3_i1.p1 TRINITY_DN937_c0_g3~~TRINITY_DN937_c0_g3_i1.p1  ORF type:complete len:221 (-),score=31.36 TRINITY_DN937_c0_g3_i1:631-1293(-)